MSGGVPRSSSPPRNGDGFSIGTSGTNDCGVEDDGEDGVEGRARIGET